ncbi:DUF2939 domain-containing protein [Phenylobacterium sp.]|jgi:hypothetical protein|uniref:DUF2939 domain-containing protein n=1 Tax=Phenylobacterium sp. TaxID=1871053 RepID=UPI002F423107
MRSPGWSGAAAALAIGLSACGDARQAAAPDVRKFLAAVAGDDRMAFEARIDRPAVRADLKGQLLAVPEVRALQDQLGDDTGDVAADKMISPESFRLLRVGAGQLPGKSASAHEIAGRLRVLAPERVCLRDETARDRCLLTFARQGGAWKLVALHAPDVTTRALKDIQVSTSLPPAEGEAD